MSSVDEFVRTSILTFPSMSKNRTEVLHHALCVLGSGYAWGEDGTIVATTDETYPLWSAAADIERIEAYLAENIPSELHEMVRPEMTKNIAEYAKVVAEVDTRMYLRTQVEHFYPQPAFSPYSALLMNTPENVTPDWKAACDEMRELAIEAGWVFPA